MSKISAYTAITSVQTDDLLPVVDVHDTSMAPTGTTKKMTLAQMPQLSQYAPTGLTGAVAPTSYAGGTVQGHPLSGTWTQGQWIVDQTGQIYVCVTAGTPGTWRRVGANPWQFFLDDYCKGDGKQALVTVASASATINTTPLAAPAAPVPATATTGGTILAGVYQVVVTYTNRWGETVGSAAGSVTTTGGASTITVPAPALSGNATGWFAYISQAGGTGASATRQQAAGSPTPMGQPLVLTAPPTATGANPPGANSSAAQVFTSTAVDAGKNIMICGALGSPGGPWIDTIATVVSPTQATLSTAGATVNQAGCAMVFSSDDRLNADTCISDAKAYALTHNNFCQVIGSDRNYGLGTGLFQSVPSTGTYQYNTQVRVPVGNPSGQTEKLEFQLLGPGDNAHNQFWVSQYVNLNGCTFISYSMGPTTADPTYGQQSIIGSPLGGTNANGSSGFANVKAVIRGVQTIQPGWSNSIGIDLQFAGGCVVRGSSHAFAPPTSTGGGVNPSSVWVSNATWQGKLGTGLRTPNAGNNDDAVVESFATGGLTTSVSCQADHLVINRLSSINGYFGVRITNADVNTHDLTIAQWSPENITGGLLQSQAGAGAHIKVHIVIDGENTSPVYDIQDNGNTLYGVIYWSDPFRTPVNGIIAPIVQGAANVEVINGSLARTVQPAPTYTLGTAFQGPWWKHVWVTLNSGTTTGILIGPTSAACTTSVGTTTAAPVTFRLPSGWWLNIQGSVKPSTFNAVPD